jgi:hypothetical protein
MTGRPAKTCLLWLVSERSPTARPTDARSEPPPGRLQRLEIAAVVAPGSIDPCVCLCRARALGAALFAVR